MIVLSVPVNKLLQKAAYKRLVRTKLVMRDRTGPFFP